jgi:hypothetical protein
VKTFLLNILLIIAIGSFAQNGGQSNESTSLKIEQIGYGNDQAYIIVTNKQSCTSNVEVKFNGLTKIYTVSGKEIDTVFVPAPIGTKIKAKPLTGCGSFDNGNLELTIFPSALPVKFVSFIATENKGKVTLQWIAEEEQVSHYIIQESLNGTDWNNTALIFSDNGNYSYTDNSGSNYYRIAEVDLNGTTNYSKIIKIELIATNNLSVYPNPVITTATVTLKSNQTGQISLYSLSGVLVRKIDVKGKNSLKIDLNGLQQGVYMISDGISLVKIYKQ